MTESTYTYTARSAANPAEVVTFTFRDGYLVVDAGVPLEHFERALRPPTPAGEEEAGEGEYDVKPWLKPLAVGAVERTYRPFDVGDVYGYADNGGLTVSAWLRAGGLRVAPVVFRMAEVDNVDAASAFVSELERRKAQADSARRLPGLLDYWASWAIAAMGTAIALGAWFRRTRKASAQQE